MMEVEEEDQYIYIDNEYYKKIKRPPSENACCVNCGEKGHLFKNCKAPITSFGIIAYKDAGCDASDKNEEVEFILENYCSQIDKYIVPSKRMASLSNKYKFLMIQRKDTMGYIDFLRGKYSVRKNLSPTKNVPRLTINTCIEEMTEEENYRIRTMTFDQLWDDLWCNHNSSAYRNEKSYAKRKFDMLDLPYYFNKTRSNYKFSEFGFPKGRRNIREQNIECAQREFTEETGYTSDTYTILNIKPIEEEFLGTNGIRYKHVYFIAKMKNNIPPPSVNKNNLIQIGEVKNVAWLTYEECISVIRPYDTAKRNVLTKLYNSLKKPVVSVNMIIERFLKSNDYFIDTSVLSGP